MSCVTWPWRPTSGSVRDGTPPPAEAAEQVGAQRDERHGHHHDERRRSAPATPKPKKAAAAAATAPALTNAQPKCGSDTSMIAATSATASQESDADLGRPLREQSDESSES